MHDLRAHGLNIRSALTLPALPPATGPPDLEVLKDRITWLPAELDELGRGFRTDGNQCCYVVDGVGAYLVIEGRRIVVDADPAASGRAIRLGLLGPALGLALHQRGIFVLHASAVDVDGRAVVILGNFGWGKSTTAAALVSQGNHLLADDLVSIREIEEVPVVVPGIPQIKLWPDAAKALGLPTEELPRVHPDHEKRALKVQDRFAATPLPLRRFYVLAGGDRVGVAPIQGINSFEAIVHHWYGARFGADLFSTVDLRHHFLTASRLAQHVPSRLLRRPASLEGLRLGEAISGEIRRDLERQDS